MESECKVIYSSVNVTTVTECTDVNNFAGPSMTSSINVPQLPPVSFHNFVPLTVRIASVETETEIIFDQNLKSNQRKSHLHIECVNVSAKKRTSETISHELHIKDGNNDTAACSQSVLPVISIS